MKFLITNIVDTNYQSNYLSQTYDINSCSGKITDGIVTISEKSKDCKTKRIEGVKIPRYTLDSIFVCSFLELLVFELKIILVQEQYLINFN